MIYFEKLSNEEKKAIRELQKRIENDLPKQLSDDSTLFYRFLKARDFDVDKAEKMLRRHIIWRKHFQIDTILKDFTPRPFFKIVKSSHLGFDKEGNMLMYIPLGKLDGREIAKCVEMNHYMKHWMWHVEEVIQQARKLHEKSNNKPQLTGIFDMDKLTIGNATAKSSIEASSRFLRIVQDNYPEFLYAVHIVNTPGYFRFLYSILKPIMSEALLQKLHIYSYSGWQEKLLEVIDADVLPAFLGGNRTDPDGNPLCTTFVGHGGEIPKIYHLPEEERNFTNRSLVKELIVPSKQKKEITVHVADAGSRIYWEFVVGNKDIGFGVFFKRSESKLDEILPIERYDTIDGVAKDSYKTQSSGNYVIVFDNTYSWMNSKEINYYITVLTSAS